MAISNLRTEYYEKVYLLNRRSQKENLNLTEEISPALLKRKEREGMQRRKRMRRKE